MFLSSINRSALISALVAGLLAITLAVIYSQRITSPVRSLTGAVKRMEEGDLGSQVDEVPGGKIGRLASAFNSMSTKLEKQERPRKNVVSDIAHELRTPPATIRGYLQIAGFIMALSAFLRETRLLKGSNGFWSEKPKI